MQNKKPKVAIVHDWLVAYAGADRVVDCMHHVFPDAVIYTLVYDRQEDRVVTLTEALELAGTTEDALCRGAEGARSGGKPGGLGSFQKIYICSLCCSCHRFPDFCGSSSVR